MLYDEFWLKLSFGFPLFPSNPQQLETACLPTAENWENSAAGMLIASLVWFATCQLSAEPVCAEPRWSWRNSTQKTVLRRVIATSPGKHMIELASHRIFYDLLLCEALMMPAGCENNKAENFVESRII